MQAALASGEISEERYQSYLKLQKELHQLAIKKDQRAMLEEKRKNKRIYKGYRKILQHKKDQQRGPG